MSSSFCTTVLFHHTVKIHNVSLFPESSQKLLHFNINIYVDLLKTNNAPVGKKYSLFCTLHKV